jgi:hypothetical protein
MRLEHSFISGLCGRAHEGTGRQTQVRDRSHAGWVLIILLHSLLVGPTHPAPLCLSFLFSKMGDQNSIYYTEVSWVNQLNRKRYIMLVVVTQLCFKKGRKAQRGKEIHRIESIQGSPSKSLTKSHTRKMTCLPRFCLLSAEFTPHSSAGQLRHAEFTSLSLTAQPVPLSPSQHLLWALLTQAGTHTLPCVLPHPHCLSFLSLIAGLSHSHSNGTCLMKTEQGAGSWPPHSWCVM